MALIQNNLALKVGIIDIMEKGKVGGWAVSDLKDKLIWHGVKFTDETLGDTLNQLVVEGKIRIAIIYFGVYFL